MTLFDIIAIGVIAVSALASSSRGAVHELVSLVSFLLAVLATVALLPVTTSIAHPFLHVRWLSAAVAAVASFVAVLIFIRYVAANLIPRPYQVGYVSDINRFGGALLGGFRGIVCLGLFALVFNRATPVELQPRWITSAMLYPMASATAHTLQTVIPSGLHAAQEFAPKLNNGEDRHADDDADEASERSSVKPATEPKRNVLRAERAKTIDHGYTKRARDSVDALVEKSQ